MRAAWVTLGLAAATLTVVTYVVDGDEWTLAFLAAGLVGAFIAWKVPGHATGKLMIGLSAVAAVSDSVLVDGPIPATSWIGVALPLMSVAMPLLMGLLILTFPSGRFDRGAWPQVTALAAGVTVVGFFGTIGTGDEPPVVVVLLATFVIAALVDLVLRFRKMRGDERAQTKLVVLAAVLTPVFLALPILINIPDERWDVFVITGLSLVPLAVAIAVTRYRLFEIDRLVSRTVTYTIVVGFLGLLFAAGVVWIPSLVGLEDNAPLVAASTLAVAALFNPLRKRIQRHVDRQFNRSAYTANVIVEEFAARVREPLTTAELADLLNEAVASHLQPESIGVWISHHDSEAHRP